MLGILFPCSFEKEFDRFLQFSRNSHLQQQDPEERTGAGLLGSTPQVSHRSARPSRELGLHPATACGCSSTCSDRRDTMPAPRQLLSDTSDALEAPLGPCCDLWAGLLGVFQPGSVLRWCRFPSGDANSTSQTSR